MLKVITMNEAIGVTLPNFNLNQSVFYSHQYFKKSHFIFWLLSFFCHLRVHLVVQLSFNLLGSEDLHNLFVLLVLVLDHGRHVLLCLVLGSWYLVFINNDSLGDRSYC